MDLVSTVIPVFNRPDMLVEAAGSVLAQTWRPIEIIIVDDGSTDRTAAVAGELAAKHAEVRVIHQPNGGVGRAREAGRLIANGAFIQYLDSDDVLLPRKFELQVEGLRANPEAGASYGWTRVRTAGQVEPHPAKRTGTEIATLFPSMLQSRWWHTPTPLWRRALVDAAGPWLAQNNEEDWEYDARMASLGVKLHYVADWICEVRRHEAPGLSDEPLAPRVLRDRARAHSLILDHALRAGITPDAPEMRHFARELFLLARQCGAAGLASESRMLFDRAREASGANANRLQFRLYAAAARLLGWSAAGRLACFSDRLRW
jgi:glycosyltransferase involved in cell wall biosynthesis